MSIENFIPEVWSARLLESLRNAHVYAQPNVMNREWEGEINQVGDSVRITSVGPVSVSDYTRNQDIAAPETLSDAEMTLTITQAKYFNFQVDDLDKIQSRPGLMDGAMREAAWSLANTADTYVSTFYTEVPTSNWIGNDTTPVTPTASTAYDHLVDLSVILDDNNCPADGRWVIVAPWFHGLLLKDPRFVSFGTDQNRSTIANAQVGKVGGFTVLKSNKVPNIAGTKYKVIAGHQMALTFAQEVKKVEAYRPEKRFADAVKGLHFYGAKLIRPNLWAVLDVNKPA